MINFFKCCKRLFVLLLFALVLLPQVNAQDIPAGYNLVWSEEFDVDGPPNPEIWKHEKGFVRNQEWQWYQSDNAWCEDGMLIIEGRKEKKTNPNYDPNSDNWKKKREFINYTSSSIKTAGKKTWKYGIFEIKAKIPAKSGMWPAIWTLGKSGEWPRNGECDIMEYYGGKILANFAWGTNTRWKAKWDGANKKVSSFDDPDWKNKFHVWKLVWTRNKMTIYVDDVWLNSVNVNNTINAHDGSNPFRQPHYILLNLAIGSNGGDASKTTFPQRYLVDYVKVYQLPELNFKGSQGDAGEIQLTWDNPLGKEIVVQRSVNGGEFTDLATISDPKELAYTDESGTKGECEYRLFYLTDNNTKVYSEETVAFTILLPQVENVALNKLATTDSQHLEYSPDKVLDGDIETNDSRWVSTDAETEHWIEIDLQEKFDISHLKFYSGWDGYNSAPVDFNFQGWDGTGWKDLLVVTGNLNPKFSRSFEPYSTEKVRLSITKSKEDRVKIYEVEVYGTPAKPKVTSSQENTQTILNIYPNPSSEKISISGYSRTERLNARIYNSQGVLVIETDQANVGIQHLAKGVYFVRVNGSSPYKVIKK